MTTDEHFPVPNGAIYDNYTATLNQANITQNNNKFYIIQVVVVSTTNFYIWTRYGRVGSVGATKLEGPSIHPDVYTRKFRSLFRTKTGIDWDNRLQSSKPNKYAYMKLYSGQTDQRLIRSIPIIDPTLGDRVSLFVKELCSEKLMKTAMQTLEIDTNRLPLGNLSVDQLKDAGDILKVLENIILSRGDAAALETQSSRFFTLIPQASRMNQRLPTIKTLKQIQNYATMLDDLRNIQIASVAFRHTNTLKGLYETLCVNMRPVEDIEKELLSHIIQKTVSDDHRIVLELVDAVKIDKDIQDQNDVNKLFDALQDRRMLFHGSRTWNFAGILTEGLRMPRPNQVANGSILGLGCYFADCSSKSFQYCSKDDDCGYMLLCEVALGKKQIVRGACLDILPNGFDSRVASGVKITQTLNYKGVEYPVGPLIMNPNQSFTTFRHNEYVIYKPEQYRFRYLMKVRGRNI
jgi:poly [ADP-ribose] polymerase 2/3/4